MKQINMNTAKILALFLALALLPLAYAQKTTNVSVLYGWNGTRRLYI